jgi:hypothetical protein
MRLSAGKATAGISNSLTVFRKKFESFFAKKHSGHGWQDGTKRFPYYYCKKTVFIHPKILEAYFGMALSIRLPVHRQWFRHHYF